MTATQNSNTDDQNMVISYLTIRKAVGILGIALPVLLGAGAWFIGSCPHLDISMSAYYYSVMGNALTGTLCAVGLFLFTYKGYDRHDQIASNIAAVGAYLTALFPTNGKNTYGCDILTKADNKLSNTVHYLAAALFFISLAYISIFLFTKSDKATLNKAKRQRNTIYRVCGIVMLVAMVGIPFLKIKAVDDVLGPYKAEFWMEAVVLWAFGFSWLVKGGTILKDQ